MIELTDVTVRREGRVLFSNATFALHKPQKIGLTGNNGVGKSTLFAVLLGEFGVDAGRCAIAPSWQIAHMSQEMQASEQEAIDYVLSGDKEWYAISQSLAHQDQLSSTEIAKLHQQFDNIDGYRTPARAAQILSGLGFGDDEHNKAVSSFSGGWRMRLNLARTLMHRADVLLLDEPTNHLDLDAILWLEQWLVNYDGLVMVISHDQAFLDAVVDFILHIEQERMTLYSGNYSQFVRTRSERLAQRQQAYDKQQATKAHLESFINRFKAKASKAKQAQSRIKQLERMADLAPVMADNPFSFQFYEPLSVASPLVKLINATIGYDAHKPIINQANLEIQSDTRLGILGANGAGKSTLIKALVSELDLLAGEKITSDKVSLGYFNQHQMDGLDLSATPITMLRRIAGATPDDKLRAFLGSFDFRGDRIDTKAKLFSGGEKARLTLALIVWSRPNLLVLDEPTNHLDLQMRDALMMALQNFDGALILVSHDRELILGVCDTLVLVSDGKVQEFTGDMKDYALHLKAVKEAKNKKDVGTPPKEPTKEELRKKNADIRQKTAPLRQKIQTLETELETLTQTLAQIETTLANTTLYEDNKKAKLMEILDTQASTLATLNQKEELLIEQMMTLETLNAELTSQ